MPAVYAFSLFMSYGKVEPFRHAANYIDRILRGGKPADLPVQEPTRFETAVNIKTATALGELIERRTLLQCMSA